MPANRIAARWKRQHKVALRAAALTMVGAYEMLGLTRSAAVATTSTRLDIGSRSIWTWLDWAGPEVPSAYTLECLGATKGDLR